MKMLNKFFNNLMKLKIWTSLWMTMVNLNIPAFLGKYTHRHRLFMYIDSYNIVQELILVFFDNWRVAGLMNIRVNLFYTSVDRYILFLCKRKNSYCLYKIKIKTRLWQYFESCILRTTHDSHNTYPDHLTSRVKLNV